MITFTREISRKRVVVSSVWSIQWLHNMNWTCCWGPKLSNKVHHNVWKGHSHFLIAKNEESLRFHDILSKLPKNLQMSEKKCFLQINCWCLQGLKNFGNTFNVPNLCLEWSVGPLQYVKESFMIVMRTNSFLVVQTYIIAHFCFSLSLRLLKCTEVLEKDKKMELFR